MANDLDATSVISSIPADVLEAARRIIDTYNGGHGYHIDDIVSDGTNVARALLAAAERERVMREALTMAAIQFEFYGTEHRLKEQAARFNYTMASAEASAVKAQANEEIGAVCRAALAHDGKAPDQPPEPPNGNEYEQD